MTALHPELEMYLETSSVMGMQMIRHPLVYAVPYFGEVENDRLNKMLDHKKQALVEALEAKDYARYIFMHERPYRLDALVELSHLCHAASEMNPLILSVYTDSENISQNYEAWTFLFEPLVGKDPWNTLCELPDEPFFIYRGGSKNGFSWTTDVEKARWFADRFNRKLPMWRASVTKKDVLGYYNGRSEKEVIVHPNYIAGRIEKLKR